MKNLSIETLVNALFDIYDPENKKHSFLQKLETVIDYMESTLFDETTDLIDRLRVNLQIEYNQTVLITKNLENLKGETLDAITGSFLADKAIDVMKLQKVVSGKKIEIILQKINPSARIPKNYEIIDLGISQVYSYLRVSDI